MRIYLVLSVLAAVLLAAWAKPQYMQPGMMQPMPMGGYGQQTQTVSQTRTGPGYQERTVTQTRTGPMMGQPMYGKK